MRAALLLSRWTCVLSLDIIIAAYPSPPENRGTRSTFNPDHRRRTHVPAPAMPRIDRRLAPFVKPLCIRAGLLPQRAPNRILISGDGGVVLGHLAADPASVRPTTPARSVSCGLRRNRQPVRAVRPLLDFPAVCSSVLYASVALPPACDPERRITAPAGAAARFAGAIPDATTRTAVRKLDALHDRSGVQLAGHVERGGRPADLLPASSAWSDDPTPRKAVATPGVLAGTR